MALEPEEYRILHAIGDLERQWRAQGVPGAFRGVTQAHISRMVGTGHRAMTDVLTVLVADGYLDVVPVVFSFRQDSPDAERGFKLTGKARRALAEAPGDPPLPPA